MRRIIVFAKRTQFLAASAAFWFATEPKSADLVSDIAARGEHRTQAEPLIQTVIPWPTMDKGVFCAKQPLDSRIMLSRMWPGPITLGSTISKDSCGLVREKGSANRRVRSALPAPRAR